jgi:hypothetical protein
MIYLYSNKQTEVFRETATGKEVEISEKPKKKFKKKLQL